MISTLKGKQVVQDQKKFILTSERKEAESKIEVDQAYKQYFLFREMRVPIMSMSMGSFLIGRIGVPMFDLDRVWKETSYGMDQAMGSIDSQEGKELMCHPNQKGVIRLFYGVKPIGGYDQGDHWRVFYLRVFSS